jgi:hypothetical protein
MRGRIRARSAPVALLPLAVVLGLLTPTSASAITSAQCDAQVNDTPAKLLPCIQQDDLWSHMVNLQKIADDNPGPDGHASRNSGEPGYKASADYVAQKMRDAGYNVKIQTYPFTYFAYRSKPSFSEVSPAAKDFELDVDWSAAKSTGVTTAALQPVNVTVPPTADPSSASGCTAADFADFVPGRVALIQRGSCNFGVKAINAQAAGASGVIIFNEGQPGRTGLVGLNLLDANNNEVVPTIPVGSTTFAIGSDLVAQYRQAVQNGTALPVVSLGIDAIIQPNTPDYNVIAESKGGDPNHTLVVDAHLDAIYGAGMLDNGSGSMAILDIAQKMKNVTPRNKLRFIWFGGEELGLFGSKFYVDNLSSSEANHIGYDLDADVFGTPNGIIGVLDPAAPDFFSRVVPATFPSRVYKASQVSEQQSIDYFNSLGLNHELLSPNGTDAISFNSIGIPASGMLTGQDCCKSQDEVNLFGGVLGNYEGNIPSFDGGCVDLPFRWCDNIDNVNPEGLETMSKAFANTVVQMAFDTKVMSASNNSVIHTKVPASAQSDATRNNVSK